MATSLMPFPGEKVISVDCIPARRYSGPALAPPRAATANTALARTMRVLMAVRSMAASTVLSYRQMTVPAYSRSMRVAQDVDMAVPGVPRLMRVAAHDVALRIAAQQRTMRAE